MNTHFLSLFSGPTVAACSVYRAWDLRYRWVWNMFQYCAANFRPSTTDASIHSDKIPEVYFFYRERDGPIRATYGGIAWRMIWLKICLSQIWHVRRGWGWCPTRSLSWYGSLFWPKPLFTPHHPLNDLCAYCADFFVFNVCLHALPRPGIIELKP